MNAGGHGAGFIKETLLSQRKFKDLVVSLALIVRFYFSILGTIL